MAKSTTKVRENNNKTIEKLNNLRDKMAESKGKKGIFNKLSQRITKTRIGMLKNRIEKNKLKYSILDYKEGSEGAEYTKLVEDNEMLLNEEMDLKREELELQEEMMGLYEKLPEYSENFEEKKEDKINKKIEKLKPKGMNIEVSSETEEKEDDKEQEDIRKQLEEKELKLEEIVKKREEIEEQREQLVSDFKEAKRSINKVTNKELAIVNNNIFRRFRNAVVKRWESIKQYGKDKLEQYRENREEKKENKRLKEEERNRETDEFIEDLDTFIEDSSKGDFLKGIEVDFEGVLPKEKLDKVEEDKNKDKTKDEK